jgi:hypothetical protein
MKTKSTQLPTDSTTIPPDCESVRNFLNLLPRHEQDSQDLENVDSSIAISRDANESEIDLQKIGNVSESDVIGCNMDGSDNNVCPQHNTVSDNYGVTGISGTGHTINNYACPPEIVELILKLAKKEGLL